MTTLSVPQYCLNKENFDINFNAENNIKRIQSPLNIGKCYSDIFKIDPDLTLIYSYYRPACDLIINSDFNPHKNHVLAITLGLQGKSYYKEISTSQQIEFSAGYTTINSFHQSTGKRVYKAGEIVSQLRLIVGKNLLHQYIGIKRTNLLLSENNLIPLSHHKTFFSSHSHASALMHHLNEKSIKNNSLTLHSRSLCLLEEQLDFLLPNINESNPKLSPDEIKSFEKAQNIIQNEMEKPITEEYLCNKINISKCKLREGFRVLFNSTPHKMLLEARMRKAYLLLISGHQVAQTAWSVGYNHPNNFSVAFNKFYGYSPKMVYKK